MQLVQNLQYLNSLGMLNIHPFSFFWFLKKLFILGKNNDQLVPATPEGVESLGAVPDETEESTSNNQVVGPVMGMQSRSGRRTPRLLSPSTTRNTSPSVLQLFTGDDFFD